MALNYINAQELSRDILDMVEKLRNKYSDINEIYNNLMKKASNTLQTIEALYDKYNYDKTEFTKEKDAILKTTYKDFVIEVLFRSTNKAGEKLKQLGSIYNKVLKDKEAIIQAYNDKMNKLKSEVESDLAKNKISESQKKMIAFITERNNLVMLPDTCKEQSKNSLKNFIDNVITCLDDLKFNQDGTIGGYYTATKEDIDKIKKQHGLSGRDAPRIKNGIDVKIKPLK